MPPTVVRMNDSFEIDKGPGKFDLMLAIFDRKVITFSLHFVKKPLLVRITSVAIDPRSNDSWLIKGHAVDDENITFDGWYGTSHGGGGLIEIRHYQGSHLDT